MIPFSRMALAGCLTLAVAGCGPQTDSHDNARTAEKSEVSAGGQPASLPRPYAPDPREKHFATLTMLTDGGENAEAYFSFGGKQLVFQTTRPPYDCDQIMVMPVSGGTPRLVSTGTGRTTCAYFTGDDRHVLFASTHLASPDCPPPPDMSRGYVWALYPGYDIFSVELATGKMVQLTDTPGYDAEATVNPAADRVVFTSVRDGDLEIYSMNPDGSDVQRLTHEPGYDGGPFYSPDGTLICYRAHHPAAGQETADYRALLADHKIRPSRLEIWIMHADGSGKRQITDLGCASFAPFFHPSGQKIIFSTNYPDARGREFELYLIDLYGENLERVSYSDGFDGFPMWAPDGKTFVFASNRHNGRPGETNIFVTEWVD